MNHQTSIQKGQGMSIHALRTLAQRTSYDDLNIIFYFENKETVKRCLLSTIYKPVKFFVYLRN